MSDQSPHKCSPEGRAKERRLFLCYAGLAIALAVGFGYSMASMKFQENLVRITELHADTIKNLDARHSRVLNKQIKNLREDLHQCLIQKTP